VFRYFNVIASFAFLSVALFAQKIVQIKIPGLDFYLIGQEFWSGLQIVPILLAAYWFQGWYMNFSAGIFIKEETKVLPQITLIGAAVTVVANLVLIPQYGMIGSATATLISYATMAFLLYFRSVRMYPVSYELGRGIGMIVIAALCLVMQSHFINWIGSEWTANLLLLLIGTILFLLLGYRRGATTISE
jgi:O-antigen/teichoic acid export membrane protein